MSLFRIVSLCLFVCNFTFSQDRYKDAIRSDGSFHCLRQAACNENLEDFKGVLEAGARKYIFHGNDSIMTCVIEAGWVPGVKALLSHGYKVDIPDFYTKFPEASPQDNLKLSVYEHLNRTPLMRAVMAGKLNVAEVLVGAGANVNAVDCNGKSVLDHAMERDVMWSHGRYRLRSRTVKFLVDKGVEIRFADTSRVKSILDLACEEN